MPDEMIERHGWRQKRASQIGVDYREKQGQQVDFGSRQST